ncbi:MAG TPA: Na/Pi cotransporter family protein [Candidatus Faecaligallichristensenella faecipullorum]|nr:Na/Pi cotransporter family protein [Candidatus Faecaligallichristensenella faecipullorum]
MSFGMIMGLMSGLGLFLYGMKMMGEGLEKAAGANLRRLLEKLTKNTFMGVLVGAVFTAIIQSSSATTVMVVGFVNAGLMNLAQATGLIMGANIGTTITGQLVAFKLTEVAPIFLLAGVVMILFFKNPRIQRIGGIVAGFGVLFVGMDLMSSAMEPLKDMPEFISLVTAFSNPVLAMLVGVAMTALIQSSSAAVGLIQILGATGVLPLQTAMYLVLGTGIGTCVTALLASVGTSPMARRAAVIHLMLNVFGTTILLILFQILPVEQWIASSSGDISREIANVNTLFKVFEVVVFLPFSGMLVKLSEIIVPGEEQTEDEKRLMYIDDRILSTPPIAVAQLCKEVERMGRMAVDNLEHATMDFIQGKADDVDQIEQTEDVVNFLNHEITRFMVSASQLKLPPRDMQLLASLFHVVNDLERIGDHAENMAEYAVMRVQKKVPFSDKSMEELTDMLNRVVELCNRALTVFHTRDRGMLPKALVLEEQIDDLEKELQQTHVDRLTQGLCTPQSGMMFSDILSNLERVADHATNIAFSVEQDAQVESVVRA